jgi:hypothetical protein
MEIKGLKAGKYQVRVVNFEGSAEGHEKVWKLRSFAEKSGVTFTKQSGPHWG